MSTPKNMARRNRMLRQDFLRNLLSLPLRTKLRSRSKLQTTSPTSVIPWETGQEHRASRPILTHRVRSVGPFFGPRYEPAVRAKPVSSHRRRGPSVRVVNLRRKGPKTYDELREPNSSSSQIFQWLRTPKHLRRPRKVRKPRRERYSRTMKLFYATRGLGYATRHDPFEDWCVW